MADVNLIHCSYHKCLTVFFGRVMHSLFNRCLPWSRGYRHYNSHLEDFYNGFREQRVASVNNRFLDLERLGKFRVSRFVRDPRDLLVSGYFYHRRGAEAWTRHQAPTARDWYFANGVVPHLMRGQQVSFAEHLQSVPKEAGLLAELEFRRRHFESMGAWPESHPYIMVFRYEELVGNESAAFERLFEFYELTALERRIGGWLVRRFAWKPDRSDAHVRDPTPGQWRAHFTPRVERAFLDQHPGLLERLGYEAD